MSAFSFRARSLALITAAVFAPVSFASAQCPDNPDALGTARVLTLNPRVSQTVGRAQYRQSLRLNRQEVVLTFNGGPTLPYTEMILDALASECVKATFFTLGSNVVEDPEQVRRIASQGHTIGSKTFNYVSLAKLPWAQATKEIDEGIDALNVTLGGEHHAPFFRAPMLQLSRQLERHVIARGMTVWSMDVDSRDWTDASEEEIVEETMRGLQRSGGGIIAMRDMQPATARALPALLDQLKRRKFRVVHVVAGPAVVARQPRAQPKASGKRPRRK
jgi:peptidoglycan/xylan/chitin deacetylase (PgdA/CDA1 family)